MSTLHEDKIRAAYAQASVLSPLAAGYSKEQTLSMLTEALELSSNIPRNEEDLNPLMESLILIFDARKLTGDTEASYPSAPLRKLIRLLDEASTALIDFGMDSIRALGLDSEPTAAERAVVEKIMSM